MCKGVESLCKEAESSCECSDIPLLEVDHKCSTNCKEIIGIFIGLKDVKLDYLKSILSVNFDLTKIISKRFDCMNFFFLSNFPVLESCIMKNETYCVN